MKSQLALRKSELRKVYFAKRNALSQALRLQKDLEIGRHTESLVDKLLARR